MNSTKQNSFQRYKECAGKDCQNEGKIELIVRYIDRRGYFCESCADVLIRLGLAKHVASITTS
jgi:hypothetical protein